MTIRDEAEVLLGRLTGSPSRDFRNGQWEAIEQLVERRGRVLVVQRTGWGKSAVYFVATRLLRDGVRPPREMRFPPFVRFDPSDRRDNHASRDRNVVIVDGSRPCA